MGGAAFLSIFGVLAQNGGCVYIGTELVCESDNSRLSTDCSAGNYNGACQLRNLETDLNHSIQQIPTVVFALPNFDRSWQKTGQVVVSARDGAVTISGSLVTNVHQHNAASGNVKNVSLLGGCSNRMAGAAESTIIGGFTNRITATMSFIAGGTENQITRGSKSTILGGKNNTITGKSSIIVGVGENTISGSNSTIIGGNNEISGTVSLVAGNNVEVNAHNTFVWNDGESKFTITKSNLFAVKGTKGMVIGKNTPNVVAALSVKGGLRVQYNEEENKKLGTGLECKPELVGTIKTVQAFYNSGTDNKDQYCPCLCTSKKGGKEEWTSILLTPQCVNACEGRDPGPQGEDFPVCDKDFFGKCEKGEPVVGVYSYVYGSITGNTDYQGTSNGLNYPAKGVTSHWYRVCRNPETNISITCNADNKHSDANFRCSGQTPANAYICSYSSVDPNEAKKDDRELNQNVNKTLVGTEKGICKGAGTTDAQLGYLTKQISSCNNAAKQDAKCEFYCPDGYHKEGTTAAGKCVANSCGTRQVSESRNGATPTFTIPCMNDKGTYSTGNWFRITNGQLQFSVSASCNTGNFKSSIA
jgi:hypothetical protein